jgi:CubicO group peptidase (beta-lactamase class C family)
MSLDDVTAALDAFIASWLPLASAPGVSVVITDRERTLHVSAHGYRDALTRTPLREDDLLQTGSVGKGFTSVALLRLQERGRLSIDDEVTKHLPWFSVRSAYDPIRLWHLMTHTAGIINGTDWTGEGEYEVRSMRDTEATAPPGDLYHYSNAGYKALGLLLQEVWQRPVAEVLEQDVLGPLGMKESTGAIRNADRLRVAPGHAPYFDDRAWRPAHGLAPTVWIESTTADGSLCSPPEDMGRYMRMLMNRGRGDDGQVLSEESFDLMVGRNVDSPEYEEGSRYGLGLLLTEVDGHRWIGHGGSTVGYQCAMRMDVDEGLGVMALTNGQGNAFPIVQYALRLLRADRAGDAAPAPPPLPDRIEDAERYAGRFASSNGSITVSASGGGLEVARDGGDGARLLRRDDGDAFTVDADAWEPFPLVFRAAGDRVVAATHGPEVFVPEGWPLPAAPTGEWAAFEGHYRTHDLWYPTFRVVDRTGSLVLISGEGEEEPLERLPDGSFRAGEDPRLPERVRFEEREDGGPVLRASYSGLDYFRSFTP